MRKYISMIMVALAALFVTTSCELASGTDPNPNRKDQLLWGRVKESIHLHYDYFCAVAHLNDTLLNKEYVSDIYPACEIEVKDNVYTFIYSSSYYAASYRIKTDGKRLDEGGEWTVDVKYGTYMEPYKLGTVKGVVGEPMKFSFDFDDTYAYNSLYRSALKSDIELWYNADKACFDITFSNAEGFSVEHYSSSTPDYIIEFKTTEPMVYEANELYSGEVNILYKDNVLHTQRGVTVEIFNKFITFVPLN